MPGDQNRFVYSLVIQQQISEKLHYVAVQNLGTEQNAPAARRHRRMVRPQPVLSLYDQSLLESQPAREWLRDDDGVRVAGPGNIPGIYAWNGRGYAGNFYEVTARSELATEWQLAGAARMPLGLV